IAARPQHNENAYESYQRGVWHHYKHTGADNRAAQELYRKALSYDPDYCPAIAGLAHAICIAGPRGWAADPEQHYAQAFTLAQRAVVLDGRDPTARFVLGLTAMYVKQSELAITQMREAITLNPSFSAALVILGQLMNYAGHPEEAIDLIER